MPLSFASPSLQRLSVVRSFVSHNLTGILCQVWGGRHIKWEKWERKRHYGGSSRLCEGSQSKYPFTILLVTPTATTLTVVRAHNGMTTDYVIVEEPPRNFLHFAL
jgi:hypothetical protein